MKKITYHASNLHSENRGQAMTEFCIAGPLLVLLLWSLIYMTEMYIVKHETLVAARYGTWLLSRYDNIPQKPVDIDQVRQLIADNFFKERTQGLQIIEQHVGGDQDSSGFQEDIEDQSGSGGFIDEIVGFIGDNMMGTDTPNIYSLRVQSEYPRLFGAVDLRENGSENFNITSQHFVIGNSWDGQRVDTHDILDMVGKIISEIFDMFN
jgi:hypothetical protein